METIILTSRYNDKYKLHKVEDKKYKVDPSMGSFRVGLIPDDPNHFSFIDPSGGPFLAVGDKVPEANNAVIESIEAVKGGGTFIIFK